MTETQRAIVDCFDLTYRRRGTGSLRPIEAYLMASKLLGAPPDLRTSEPRVDLRYDAENAMTYKALFCAKTH